MSYLSRLTSLLSTSRAALLAAGVLLAPMALAGQGASPAKLHALFEAQNTASSVEQIISAMEGQQRARFEAETDPEKKEKAKAIYDVTSKTIRRHLDWAKLEPVAISAYQKHYDDAEVDALIAYYQTPAGKLHISRMVPVATELLQVISSHIGARVDEISDQIDKKQPVKKAPVVPVPTAGSKEAIALDFVRASGDQYRVQFNAQMAELDKSMQKQLEMFSGSADKKQKAKMQAEIKKMAQAIRSAISYAEIERLIADTYAKKMSQEELALLLDDAKNPKTRSLQAQRFAADQTMSQVLQEDMQKNIMPKLMMELLSIMKTGGQPATETSPQ